MILDKLLNKKSTHDDLPYVKDLTLLGYLIDDALEG